MISAKSQIKITYFVPSNVQNKKENCLSSRIILNDLNSSLLDQKQNHGWKGWTKGPFQNVNVYKRAH